MAAVKTALPTFDSVVGRIAAAERGQGWLSVCEDAGRFLVPCRELIASLAERLAPLDKSPLDKSPLDDGPVLEVCAGRGELAQSLRAAGVRINATDVESPHGTAGFVERMPADEALRQFRPALVLGSFVPVDSGIDRMVMSFPSVRHYVALGARIGGLFGSASLWEEAGWTARPLDAVTRWLLTRHDVWIDRRRILRHGEAWLFSRNLVRLEAATKRNGSERL